MNKLFAVIAKTTSHESILDSIWDDKDIANDRMYEIWDYPTIFRAEIQHYQLNKTNEELDYMNKNYELDYDDD